MEHLFLSASVKNDYFTTSLARLKHAAKLELRQILRGLHPHSSLDDPLHASAIEVGPFTEPLVRGEPPAGQFKQVVMGLPCWMNFATWSRSTTW